MTTLSKITSITEREINARIEAAVREALVAGKKPADMGDADHEALAKRVFQRASPNARDLAAKREMEKMAHIFLGGIIAETIWQSNEGWPVDEAQALAAYRATTFKGRQLLLETDQQALDCLRIFQEELPQMTRARLLSCCGRIVSDRFSPLFEAQEEGATIGEIALEKAASGDRLAEAFLSWRAS